MTSSINKINILTVSAGWWRGWGLRRLCCWAVSWPATRGRPSGPRSPGRHLFWSSCRRRRRGWSGPAGGCSRPWPARRANRRGVMKCSFNVWNKEVKEWGRCRWWFTIVWLWTGLSVMGTTLNMMVPCDLACWLVAKKQHGLISKYEWILDSSRHQKMICITKGCEQWFKRSGNRLQNRQLWIKGHRSGGGKRIYTIWI